MSRFFSTKFDKLTPYTPGEQPKDRKFVKLNTNESPFPPSEKAIKRANEEAEILQLYSDPECTGLNAALSEYYGFDSAEILCTNGSDEILNFAFMAFCDNEHPAAFADITYGFYPVFAEFNNVPYEEIPLKDDFSINVEDYIGINKTIFIANPNAPTGIALPVSEIERIVKSNPDNVIIVDEAYVDFGTESCLPLVKKYDNVLVCRTFSKSFSMAGARLGFGVGSKALMQDLNTIKYSTNPYNINRMTMAAGIGAIEDAEYSMNNCRTIAENRAYTMAQLKKLGFSMTDTKSNFIFAKSDRISGEELYLRLKDMGILIRHFSKEKICEYNRITVGTREQMDIFLDAVKKLLEEKK